ncbi:hypothetical protein ACNKHX_25980 [Shigella flexneri]
MPHRIRRSPYSRHSIMSLSTPELIIQNNGETMEKTFNHNAIEQALYQHWEAQGYFKPHGDTSKDSSAS